MRLLTVPAMGLLAAAAGCASAGTASSTGSSTGSEGYTQWTANLQPTQSRTGAATITERQRAYGSAELTVARNRSTRTRVRISVSVPAEAGVTGLRWAIHPGNCGAGMPPVMPAEAFPMIELSANGQGSIDVEIPLDMPRSGTYHVNVYRATGVRMGNVLTCGNLRGRS